MKEYQGIIDGHAHAFGKGLQGVRDMVALEREFGYDACNFLSCECMGDAAQNALGIYLKLYAPECYAFGGLSYRCPLDFERELDALWALGMDGMKMVENKPTLRRELGVPFNDKRYNGFFARLEREGIPLVSHVADPEECWDRSRIPDWAYDAGYFYGEGGYVQKETIYAEVEDVLTRFPGLRVIFAHLLFLSADLERLDRLMQRHPAMGLDIVAGTEMYFHFAERPDDWRAFFLRYQDRIFYGTDNMNLYDAAELENARITNHLEISFLRDGGPIRAWDKTAEGIALPAEAVQKICSGNFRRVVGEKPRAVNAEAARRYLQARLDSPAFRLTGEERAILTEVRDLLG